MTEREKEILALLKRKPLISQQDLADTLGIARSSAAVHIANLMKKGYILGKGYILNEPDYVVVVGGTNVDIQGFTDKTLILKDSNPGKVKLSLGGVGRNIAENLVKFGVPTKLFSAVGDDFYGEKIREECKISSIDMEHCLIFKDMPSSTYLSILDADGDMALAVSSMEIFDRISIDDIRQASPMLSSAQLVVVDTNIPQEVLHYMVSHFKDTLFFLDTVSTSKAQRVKETIGYFHTIKPNRYEAEVLSDISIHSKSDAEKALYYFLNKGVENVFISLGKDGICYGNKDGFHFMKPPEIPVINATGAGDAFMAGLIFGHLQQYSLEDRARFAMAASILALSHENTINPVMSVDTVESKLKELNLCTNNI